MTIAGSGKIVLRNTAEADLDFVLAIEREAASERFVTAWSRERHEGAMVDADQLHLTIESPGSKERLGFVLLAGLASQDDCIEFRRIVAARRGEGIGREAIRLLKGYVFRELGAHRLWLDVKDFNQRARRLYLSEGFVEEGTLRECVAGPDGYESVVVMSLLAREFHD